jgi:hypothetical protein
MQMYNFYFYAPNFQETNFNLSNSINSAGINHISIFTGEKHHIPAEITGLLRRLQ